MKRRVGLDSSPYLPTFPRTERERELPIDDDDESGRNGFGIKGDQGSIILSR